MEQSVEFIENTLVDFYKDLHQHPELSGQESRTSARIARAMEQLDFEVTRQVGGHGVVSLVRNGEGPVVLLRADMDALPMKEQTGLTYQSRATADGSGRTQVTDVAHMCGHDLHCSWLLGAAHSLMCQKESWQGTLMLVAQPSEELGIGARGMLQDGLYQRFARPDYILGQHSWHLPVGTIGHCEGPMMSGATHLKVILHGKGGHGSQPELTVDPIVLAAHIIVRLQGIISREIPPQQQAVLTVGYLHAGSKANIIPDSAEFAVDIRAYDDGIKQQICDAVRRIVRAECEASRTPREPEFEEMVNLPVTRNTPGLHSFVKAAHHQTFGAEPVRDIERVTGSEDFGYYGGFTQQPIPSLFWFTGIAGQAQLDPDTGLGRYGPHNPGYAPAESDLLQVLHQGSLAMSSGALALLQQHPSL
ncbi:amidohydrolase [Dongshaea marina]|uniref:amidohydrolase n=1 Tax=Dongshaea marina TaxID=2047966 RepID=UPI00131F065C|nr:amidohydrolase [Dongshaea marina]